MTADTRKSDRGTDIRLSGTWDPLDPVEIKKTLTSLPPAETMVVIDVSAMEDLPLGLVQVLLAYTRYARSQPRPVRIHCGQHQKQQLGIWGLDHAGWENYFHVR